MCKEPTKKEIAFIKAKISTSLKTLIKKDSNIFNIDLSIEESQQISEDAKKLNRKLHETCINHRFAHYLENALVSTKYTNYNVDIEYNRFYENLKLLENIDGQEAVRPDIVIHTRVNNNFDPQHLLVIEAKKRRNIYSRYWQNKKDLLETPTIIMFLG
ncbi:hypothetical protein C7E23_03040 [Elizabethkingia anophelis]|nr:hypothetical protein C7E23_03040 [Elizabethkingia anophelis]